ncbi:MAG: MASE1 domain-containing protein [Candidatus Acidiferrum sp.]
MTDQYSPRRLAALASSVGVLSYFVARVGGALILRPQMVSPLWLGNVVLVAVLLLVPRKIWPLLLPAGLAGFLLYDILAGEPIRSIISFTLSNAVEVLTASWCLHVSFKGIPRLNSLKALAKYSFYGVFLAPFVGAFFGAFATANNYWASWKIAFFSEALGFLTLMPAILGWVSESHIWGERRRTYYLEQAALLVALIILGHLAFALPTTSNHPALLYSLVPLLLWSTLRFGTTGVSTSIIAIAFLSIWEAVHGRGPFTEPGPIVNVASLQFFLFFTAAPFMTLSVLVEERKRSEEALTAMSGRLITAQEEERARIARELHDDLNQRMALVQMGLEEFKQGIPGLSSQAQQQLDNLGEILSDVSSDLHVLSRQLHPGLLESLGLVALLKRICTEFCTQYKLEVQFIHKDIPKEIPSNVALCLFRIVQEGLRNVAKHSGASKAEIELLGNADEIYLCISDLGHGFNVESAHEAAGLGLVSMRERLRLVGGQLSIESELNCGSRIRVRIPKIAFAGQAGLDAEGPIAPK